MEEKIVKEVMKKVKKVWCDESQVGFSELAMQDAIKLAFEAGKKISESKPKKSKKGYGMNYGY